MIRVAITGGIACGKSLVGTILARHRIPVCETDTLAHALMQEGTTSYAALIRLFGRGILSGDGSIARPVLGRLVFGSEEKRRELNRILHPRVRRDYRRWLAAQAARGCELAVVIVPLLFEAGFDRGWDGIICVASPDDLQRQRLRERGHTAAESRRRVAAQMPLAEKARRSDYVIWNCGGRDLLAGQVRRVKKDILEK